jgi:hypothetical protein
MISVRATILGSKNLAVLPLEGPVGIMLYRAIMVVCCASLAEQINNLV